MALARKKCHLVNITFPNHAMLKQDAFRMICKHCKVAMKELKGHIYHKQRKWRCPQCSRVRMQKQK
jgi:hypothetical protein